MVSSGAQRVLSIDLREGVKKYSFYLVIILGLLVNVLNTVPGVVLPVYLQEVIGISRRNAGKINSSIAVVVEITVIFLVGTVGFISDKVGRRILLSLGLISTAVSFSLLGFSNSIAQSLGINSLLMVYVTRWLVGVSMVFVWPQISALLTDYTFVQGRGKAMAIMGFTFTAGAFVTFTFISRLPKIIGITNVLVLMSVICVVFALISRLGVTELVQKSSQEKKIEWKKLFEHLKKSPGLKLAYGAAFGSRADVIILGMFLMIWVVKVAKDFGRTPMQAIADGGIVIAISSGLGMLSYPLWGFIVEKWGRLPTLTFGLFFSGLSYVLMGFIKNPFSVELKLCIILFALGVHAAGVGASTLASDIAPRNIIGSVLGGYHTCASLGIMFFLQLGGFLFDSVGHTSPFVVAGIANLIVVFFGLIFWKRIRAEEAVTKNNARMAGPHH